MMMHPGIHFHYCVVTGPQIEPVARIFVQGGLGREACAAGLHLMWHMAHTDTRSNLANRIDHKI